MRQWINETMGQWVNETMGQWINETMGQWINETMGQAHQAHQDRDQDHGQMNLGK